MKKRILYISYDGILEPLGNSQVLKYLEGLSNEFEITLISFEKINTQYQLEDFSKMKEYCKRKNILWQPKKYNLTNGPISNIINIINITLFPFLELALKKHDIVHIRSYMPGLAMPIIKKLFHFKLIFDIRGFWADEKVDRLGWKKTSLKYKFFKKLESNLFQNADTVVTLTDSSKNYIEQHFKKPIKQIKVIRTCVDFKEFNIIQEKECEDKNNQELLIGYLGSIDTAYNFNDFLRLIKDLVDRKIQVKLEILSKTSREKVLTCLKKFQLENLEFDVQFLSRSELSPKINKFNLLGFALKESFSLIASMPTKIAESLACGTPIICNNFNSDIEEMLKNNNIGVLHDFSKPLTNKNFEKIISLTENVSTPKICNSFSRKHFSLESGIKMYKEIYSDL
tara:strand:+ start:354 stop:1544 length:1191 start_codon:yes stop_codon:yes gene_type:complete